MPEHDGIRAKGHLTSGRSDWLAGLALTTREGNEASVPGFLPDHTALYGLLECIRNPDIALISITCGGRLAGAQ